jgi:hypothetical protein
MVRMRWLVSQAWCRLLDRQRERRKASKQASCSFKPRPPIFQRSLLPSSNSESRYREPQFTTIRMSVPIKQTSIKSIPTVSQCSAHTASFFQHPSNVECLMVRPRNATRRDRKLHIDSRTPPSSSQQSNQQTRLTSARVFCIFIRFFALLHPSLHEYVVLLVLDPFGPISLALVEKVVSVSAVASFSWYYTHNVDSSFLLSLSCARSSSFAVCLRLFSIVAVAWL